MKLRKSFKIVIFAFYAGMIFFLYFSGMIKRMIHPRMYPFILLSAVILLLFCIVEHLFLKKQRLGRIQFFNFVYLIPIVCIFFTNNANLSNKIIQNKGINIGLNSNQNASTNKAQKKTTDQQDNDIIEERFEEDIPKQNQEETSKKSSEKKEMIEIADADFLWQVSDISININDYVGKEVSYTGFIYRDETVEANQFVVGRLAMTCCTADAGLMGFLATYADYANIKDGDWYQIKAVIDKRKYNGVMLPYLKIYEVVKVDKPADEYVY
ncbi:MAG: TIGR03943 family protein [Bacilli bacterium]|nr:TIGR03943 family protein [Bacilli bacterium]